MIGVSLFFLYGGEGGQGGYLSSLIMIIFVIPFIVHIIALSQPQRTKGNIFRVPYACNSVYTGLWLLILSGSFAFVGLAGESQN